MTKIYFSTKKCYQNYFLSQKCRLKRIRRRSQFIDRANFILSIKSIRLLLLFLNKISPIKDKLWTPSGLERSCVPVCKNIKKRGAVSQGIL